MRYLTLITCFLTFFSCSCMADETLGDAQEMVTLGNDRERWDEEAQVRIDDHPGRCSQAFSKLQEVGGEVLTGLGGFAGAALQRIWDETAIAYYNWSSTPEETVAGLEKLLEEYSEGLPEVESRKLLAFKKGLRLLAEGKSDKFSMASLALGIYMMADLPGAVEWKHGESGKLGLFFFGSSKRKLLTTFAVTFALGTLNWAVGTTLLHFRLNGDPSLSEPPKLYGMTYAGYVLSTIVAFAAGRVAAKFYDFEARVRDQDKVLKEAMMSAFNEFYSLCLWTVEETDLDKSLKEKARQFLINMANHHAQRSDDWAKQMKGREFAAFTGTSKTDYESYVEKSHDFWRILGEAARRKVHPSKILNEEGDRYRTINSLKKKMEKMGRNPYQELIHNIEGGKKLNPEAWSFVASHDSQLLRNLPKRKRLRTLNSDKRAREEFLEKLRERKQEIESYKGRRVDPEIRRIFQAPRIKHAEPLFLEMLMELPAMDEGDSNTVHGSNNDENLRKRKVRKKKATAFFSPSQELHNLYWPDIYLRSVA